jgi:hypothetical protein
VLAASGRRGELDERQSDGGQLGLKVHVAGGDAEADPGCSA